MGLLDKLKGAFSGEQTDFKSLIQNGAIVVDVRTQQEFKSGHAKGSKNIPLPSLGSKIKELKGKKVILVCRSGARAGQAKRELDNKGIEAYNAGAWQNI